MAIYKGKKQTLGGRSTAILTGTASASSPRSEGSRPSKSQRNGTGIS